MTRYRGILFDNDGTLVDTHDLILSSFRYSTYEVLGKQIPDEEFMHKVGQPLDVQMWEFTDDPNLHEELLRVYREHNRGIHDQMIELFPGVVDGLSRLAGRGLSLGVVTSKLRRVAWHGLEITGIAPFMQCCIGAEDCDQHKPDPKPVLMGVDALHLEPGECLYVGDSPFDIAAGRDAGCDTAAALWGMFSAEELRAESPTAEFSDFPSLADWILGM